MLQNEEIGYRTFQGKKVAAASPLWSYDPTTNRLLSYCVWRPSWYATLLPPTDWIAINVRTSRSAPQAWIPSALLAELDPVEVVETREFGLPVKVAGWPAGGVTGADYEDLLKELRQGGALTKAKLGFTGEPAHILDWVPDRAGAHGSRFTRINEFPQLLRP
jgi:hypothetical protein